MVSSINLSEKVLALNELPPMQPVASKLLRILSDDEADINVVEKLIETDPALTGKLLKVVNSAYYGMRNLVDTVKLAIVILGFQELRNLVMSIVLLNLSNELLDNIDFDLKSFWRHSVYVAFFSSKLYKDVGITSHGEEFTAGLMHDIGKLVSGLIFRDYQSRISKVVNDHGMKVFEAEYLIYGTSHMEVGRFLAEKWSFPDSIVKCISSHHEDHEKDCLSSCIAVSDLIANFLGVGDDSAISDEEILEMKDWQVLFKNSSSAKLEINEEYIKEFEKEFIRIDKFIEGII